MAGITQRSRVAAFYIVVPSKTEYLIKKEAKTT